MQRITSKILNIKAYLITALYNAPDAMNHFYQQKVNYDILRGGWKEKGIVQRQQGFYKRETLFLQIKDKNSVFIQRDFCFFHGTEKILIC